MKKYRKLQTQNLIKTVIPIGIFFAYALITQLEDLRIAVSDWIGLSAAIMCLMLVGVYHFRLKSGWSTGFIITMSAIYRFFFLFRTPELSDDIFRYVFDGNILLLRQNPYNVAPIDAIAAHPELSKLATLVNHGELHTIYPPAAQIVFAAGAMIGGVFGMKLVLVALDLLLCGVMAQILKRLHQPRSHLILYAWHPLPILEIAGSGHIDGAGLFFLFTAFFFLTINFSKEINPEANPHPIFEYLAGCFLAAAVLTKWLPLAFLPGFILMAGFRQLKQAAFGFFISTLVMTGLFWPAVQNGFHTLFIYAANWEFSAFAFRTLRNVLGSGPSARLMLAAFFLMIAAIIYFRCYRCMGGVLKRNFIRNNRLAFRAFYVISIAFLMLTPTLHPWYALYLAAFLPFAAGPAGLVLSWSVFLSYRIVAGYAITGQWLENDLMPVLIISGPAIAFIASAFLKYRHFFGNGSILQCRLQNFLSHSDRQIREPSK